MVSLARDIRTLSDGLRVRRMLIVIDAYIQASNSRDTDRFESLFTVDALVHEEGQEHRGVAAIQKWLASTVTKYAFTLTPIGLSQERDKAILTVKMASTS